MFSKALRPVLIVATLAQSLWAGSSATFGANAATRYDHGLTTPLDNISPLTIIAWIRLTDLGTQFICTKGAVFPNRMQFQTQATRIDMSMGRATSSNAVGALWSSYPRFKLNDWLFVAGRLNQTTTASNTLYVGNSTGIATAPSAYATQQIGVGAQGNTAGQPFLVGNVTTLTNPTTGQIAFVAVWNRNLSDRELEELQKNKFDTKVVSGCVFSSYYGFGSSDTAVAFDYSGNALHGGGFGTVGSSFGPPISVPGGPN